MLPKKRSYFYLAREQPMQIVCMIIHTEPGSGTALFYYKASKIDLHNPL